MITLDTIIYKKFYEPDPIRDLEALLEAQNIPCWTGQERESLGSVFGEKKFQQAYFLKILRSDIERVDALLGDQAKRSVDQVEKDHYLFSFTKEELYEVLAHREEWSEFDVELAKKILTDGGETPDVAKIHVLKSKKALAAKIEDESGFYGPGWYVLMILLAMTGIAVSWYLFPTGRAIYASLLALGLFVLYHLGYVKNKKLKKCPACGRWEYTKRIGRFDNTDLLLPAAPTGYETVVYQFECTRCGRQWQGLEFEGTSTS